MHICTCTCSTKAERRKVTQCSNKPVKDMDKYKKEEIQGNRNGHLTRIAVTFDSICYSKLSKNSYVSKQT